MNGTDFNQLGSLDEDRDDCLRSRAEGRTVGEMIVLIKGSLVAECKKNCFPNPRRAAGFIPAVRTAEIDPAAHSGLACPVLGLANGALLAQLRAAACLAGLLVVFPFPQFFLNATAFEELLEPSQ